MNSFAIYYGSNKPIIARGKHQSRLLEFAYNFPCWHYVGNDKASQKALKALEIKGCVIIDNDRYKFKYPN